MDIDEIHQKKEELQSSIAELLRIFSEETHISVDNVDITPARIFGKRYTVGYLVKVKTEL